MARKDILEAKAAEEHATASASNEKVTTQMHCKCAIIAHFNEEDIHSAFSYVRVSKLACKPSYYWIKAYNEIMGTHFSIRGCHDEWYPGWARPGFSQANTQKGVDATFLQPVEGEFCNQTDGLGMTRGRADSESSVESVMPFKVPPKCGAAVAKHLIAEPEFHTFKGVYNTIKRVFSTG